MVYMIDTTCAYNQVCFSHCDLGISWNQPWQAERCFSTKKQIVLRWWKFWTSNTSRQQLMSPADDKTWTADQTTCQKRKIGFGEFYLDLAAHVSFRHRQDWHESSLEIQSVNNFPAVLRLFFSPNHPQTIPKSNCAATAPEAEGGSPREVHQFPQRAQAAPGAATAPPRDRLADALRTRGGDHPDVLGGAASFWRRFADLRAYEGFFEGSWFIVRVD